MSKEPRIGIATILKFKDLILIGKRINSHGHNTYSFPSGHLEKFETYIECAQRELEEETGLINGIDVQYKSLEPIAITNDFFKKENKHYITIYMLAEKISNKKVEIMEPRKCAGWEFTQWDNITKGNHDPLFLPIQNLIKQGYNPHK